MMQEILHIYHLYLTLSFIGLSEIYYWYRELDSLTDAEVNILKTRAISLKHQVSYTAILHHQQLQDVYIRPNLPLRIVVEDWYGISETLWLSVFVSW